jgi:hypothetical protein
MEPVSAAVIGLAAKYLPEIVGIFSGKETKAAKAASAFSNIVQDVTGTSTLSEIDKALATQPELVVRLREAVMQDAHVAEQMRLADVKDARDLQRAALAQDDTFSKRFLYYFSSGWSLFIALYLTLVTFLDIPQSNLRLVDTVVGVLIGTILGAIFQFFYGSSERSRHKDATITELTKQKGA